VQQICT